MDLLQKSILAIGIIFLLNSISGGFIQNSFFSLMDSEAGQNITNFSMCIIGIGFLMPIREVFGFWIPIPAIDEMVVGAIVAGALFTFIKAINFTKELTEDINDLLLYLFLFFANWILGKIVGIILIYIAGPSCWELNMQTAEILSPIFSFGFIAIIPLLAWFLIQRYVLAK